MRKGRKRGNRWVAAAVLALGAGCAEPEPEQGGTWGATGSSVAGSGIIDPGVTGGTIGISGGSAPSGSGHLGTSGPTMELEPAPQRASTNLNSNPNP